VLEAGACELANIRFCELPQKFGDPKRSGVALLAGYRADESSIAEVADRGALRVHNLVAKSSAFWGEIVSTGRLLSGFNPEAHFLMQFHPENDEGRPHGYSGAGIWVPNVQMANPFVWTPDPLLMGIETLWYEKSQLLRALRPEVIWRFLEEQLN
jgi:hypothetical protein